MIAFAIDDIRDIAWVRDAGERVVSMCRAFPSSGWRPTRLAVVLCAALATVLAAVPAASPGWAVGPAADTASGGNDTGCIDTCIGWRVTSGAPIVAQAAKDQGGTLVNHIVNGSFEQFSGGTADLGGPAWNGPTVAGWRLTNRGSLDIVANSYRGNGYVWTNTDGTWQIELASDRTNGWIAQSVATLKPGQIYTLSFDRAGHKWVGTQIVQVVWNGQLAGSFESTGNTEWVTSTMNVTAGAGDNILEFREVGTEGNWSGTRLDNVRLLEARHELSNDGSARGTRSMASLAP